MLAAEQQPTLFPEPDGWGDGRELHDVEYLHVRAKRIINRVPEASRMPFRYTINAYRGCAHACTYCFARPTHVFLGMGAGEDFERRIVVKVNAVEKLRRELRDPRWGGDHIAMGTNTDPYQPAEGRYQLTRGIVEVLAEARNAFSILTKSPMIVRDADVLAAAGARCALSIGTLDEEVWRASEPGTPPPRQRLEAVRRLTEAGIETSVLVAPVLPGLSDSREALAEVVARSVEAGAVSVTPIQLHLRPGVREIFMPWLERYRPDLVPLYRAMYRGSYAPAAGARLAELVGDLYRRSAPSRPHTDRGRGGPAGSSRNLASRSASASSSGITASAVESSSQIDRRTWRSSASPPK